jgi:ATPase subunit of ABC transporter with duplicated ATPase domains
LGLLVLRNEIKEQQISAQKNQEKQIQQTEKLIEKFRAKASKASMAQSLIKKIEKIDRIEVDKDDNSVMKLNFPVSVTPGKVVIEAENISKNYDEHTLKKAYLRAAMKSHPDRGGTQDAFQKVSIAYTLLQKKLKERENNYLSVGF